MPPTPDELREHAFNILRRKISGTINSECEYVLDLGMIIQVSWTDTGPDGVEKSYACDIYASDLSTPFEV